MTVQPLPSPPGGPTADQVLTALTLGVITNRPSWLAVCRWCLDVIYRSGSTGTWQHVYHGIVLCSRPLPGAPPVTLATPLDHEGYDRRRYHLTAGGRDLTAEDWVGWSTASPEAIAQVEHHAA
mgnify:FL=1